MNVSEFAISQNRAASRADSTIANQRSQAQNFMRWCDGEGVSYLPASPAIVERYLLWLAEERHRSVSTISCALWAINRLHRESSLPEPGQHPDVQTAMAGIRRRFGAPPRQKRPLTIVELGKFEYDAGPDGLRDRAAVLVGSAACL